MYGICVCVSSSYAVLMFKLFVACSHEKYTHVPSSTFAVLLKLSAPGSVHPLTIRVLQEPLSSVASGLYSK